MVEFSLILAVLVIYFAPTIVAAWRRHPRQVAILIVNLVTGFTGVGWIGSMVWAMSRGSSAVRRYEYSSDYYGGMQVSSNEQLNNHFLVTCGALVVLAAVATLGLNQARVAHDNAAADFAGTAIAASDPSAPAGYPGRAVKLPIGSVIKAALLVPAAPSVQSAPQKVRLEQYVFPTDRHSIGHRHVRHLPQKYYVDGVPLAERILRPAVVSQSQ